MKDGTNKTFSVFLVVVLLAACAAAQNSWPTKGWPTSTPAAVGLDAKVLAELDADIAAGKYGYVDSMLVIRHGKAAYDRSYQHDYDRIYGKEAKEPGPLNAHDPSGPYNYFNPWWHPFYRRGDLHTMQSVTKTITSAIIGVATARKEFPSLDTPILKFFDAAKVAHVDERKRRVNIRHLLTMTGGFDWNEQLPYTDPNNAAVRMEASADSRRLHHQPPDGARAGNRVQLQQRRIAVARAHLPRGDGAGDSAGRRLAGQISEAVRGSAENVMLDVTTQPV